MSKVLEIYIPKTSIAIGVPQNWIDQEMVFERTLKGENKVASISAAP